MLNKENTPPEILVSFAYSGFIVYTSWYSKKEKKDSQWAMTWSVGWTLFCIFLFKLLLMGQRLYSVWLKLRKTFACVRKTYFLLKTFSERFHPSRKFIFTTFLQKYGSSILNVLDIDENSLQIQMAINILDQFHSSLYRKKIFRGLNTLLHSKDAQFRAVLRTLLYIYDGSFLQNSVAKTSIVEDRLGSKYPYGCTFLFIIIQNITDF